MTRFDRITMQGFKSFANKVTIPFPSGFNIIAGPNGSGKSNIIDAMMFVLGTSSARSIRAQKLQNLIFNGARDRKPADYAEVSIYLDNSDKKIPGEDDEVKIVRRVSRSGVSIYKVNGKTVTRSRILDIFANINLSPDGYNIIMQGDVARIIEMNPMERRGIIDDISGISEFDDKKEKATKELEKVELMVRENMIVMAEKQRLVERLKKEKENAERFEKLNKDLRKSRASLFYRKIVDVEKEMEKIDEAIKKDSEELEKDDKEFQEFENRLETEEKELRKTTDDIIKRSRDYDVLRKMDLIRTEIIRKKDKIDFNEREISRIDAFSGDRSLPVKAILDLKKSGVIGTISSLVSIPNKYSTAMEVAFGKHANDIVVENDDIVHECVNYLKQRRIGRARFIPLNKIRGKRRDYKGIKIIGHALDLIEFDPKYQRAFEYILGTTLVVERIEDAKEIRDFRVVTLDGDMKEKGGAIIGGFYKKKGGTFDFKSNSRDLKQQNDIMQIDIENLEKELISLRETQQEESEDVKKLQEIKTQKENELDAIKKDRRKIYETRMVLQSKLGKIKIERAQKQATLENLKMEFEEYKDVTEFFTSLNAEELQDKVRKIIAEINKLGPVNMKSLEEFGTINVEFEELRNKLNKLLEEKDAVMRIVQDVEKRRYEKFTGTLEAVSKNFSQVFSDMTGGGGVLRLEDPNIIESGLIIEVSLPGKGTLNLDSISGGEKTLTSLSFLFAIMEHNQSPFYILDEIDAALDKANTLKITKMIKKYSADKQFIVISHNDITIAEADKVFGVSMEDGGTKVFGIEMPKAKA